MREERHWRPYPTDETCVLHLPFYAYGAEQSKIWDLSTSHNDGTITGAVPNPGSPMLSPVELMPNQVDRDFSGASAWTNVDLNAYNEATDLTITANTAAQYCTCPVASVPTTIGKRYRLYYDLANIVQTWTVKSFDGTQTIGTISANITQGYLDFVASTTGGLRLVAVADTSSGDFDNFSLKEITGYTGLGWYFDGVDDNIDCGDVCDMGVGDFTLLAWINPIKVTALSLIINKNDGNRYYQLGITSTSKVYSYIRDDTGSVTSTNDGTSITIGKYQHLAVSFDRDGLMTRYLNGVATGTANDISAKSGDLDNLGSLIIANSDPAGDAYNGLVSEIPIFNRAFSAQEIRNHYEMTRHIFS